MTGKLPKNDIDTLTDSSNQRKKMLPTSFEAIAHYLSLPADQTCNGQMWSPYQLDGVPGFVTGFEPIQHAMMPDCYRVFIRDQGLMNFITVR